MCVKLSLETWNIINGVYFSHIYYGVTVFLLFRVPNKIWINLNGLIADCNLHVSYKSNK